MKGQTLNEAPRPLDRQVIVRLGSQLYRDAMTQARKEDRTLSALIRLSLRQYLEANTQPKKEKKR